MTVAELMILCQRQVLLGNGDKEIFVAADDEGNYFHKLLDGFTTDANIIDKVDLDSVDDPENVVLL